MISSDNFQNLKVRHKVARFFKRINSRTIVLVKQRIVKSKKYARQYVIRRGLKAIVKCDISQDLQIPIGSRVRYASCRKMSRSKAHRVIGIENA